MPHHLDSAVLRRYVDEPDVLLSYEKEHLLGCAPCRGTLDELRHNAQSAVRALELEDELPDLERARAAFARRAAPSTHSAPIDDRTKRAPATSRWVPAAAAAAILMLLFSYAPFRVYAQSLLTIFEPRQIAPISLTTAEFKQMHDVPQLDEVGTVHVDRQAKERRFTSLAAAQRDAGIAVLHPAYLPAALAQTSSYEVIPSSTVHFTFDARKAKASAARKHMTIPVPPPGVDGATLSATTGPLVVQFYGTTGEHPRKSGTFPHDAVVVMQAPVPAVRSTSGDVRQIESYLLSLPNVPDAFKAQIRAIQDPASTLPVPVAVDKNSAREVNVNGARGLLIGDNTGVGSLVSWFSNGRFYSVAGGFSADEMTKVAESMAR